MGKEGQQPKFLGVGEEKAPRSQSRLTSSWAAACLHISSTLSLYLRTSHAKGKNCLRVWKNSMGLLEENSGRKAGHKIAPGKLGEEGEGWWCVLFSGKAKEGGEQTHWGEPG